MTKPVQPLMGTLQEELDAILYPNIAEDVVTVRELIGQFGGRQGGYFLQGGPGFTRRRLAPSLLPPAPRVLSFGAGYRSAQARVDRSEPDAQQSVRLKKIKRTVQINRVSPGCSPTVVLYVSDRPIVRTCRKHYR